MKREWPPETQAKRTTGCRISACVNRDIQLAHVVPRRYDRSVCNVRTVHPDDVVPLCTRHHQQYDAHRLDLLPYLTLAEQAAAVAKLGIIRALKHITGAPRERSFT